MPAEATVVSATSSNTQSTSSTRETDETVDPQAIELQPAVDKQKPAMGAVPVKVNGEISRPEGYVKLGRRPNVRVLRKPEDIDSEWLTKVYRARGFLAADRKVTTVALKPLGEGTGVMGCLALVSVEFDGPNTSNAPTEFVAKFSPVKSGTPSFIIKNIFGTEAHWYNDLFEDDEGLGRPAAFFIGAKFTHKRFWIRDPVFCMLVEKMPPPLYSRTSGCANLEHLRAVMAAIGVFHAKWWGKRKAAPVEWLNHPDDYFGAGKIAITAGYKLGISSLRQCFGDTYEPVLKWEHLFRNHLRWISKQIFAPPLTVTHGDVHLDNIFFSPQWPKGLKFIDFGNISFAQGGFDVAYFIGTNLEPEVRRQHEQELMALYHSKLIEGGVTNFTLEQCWRSYKLNLFRVMINIAFMCKTQFASEMRRGTGMWAANPTKSDAKLKETYDAINKRLVASFSDAKFDEFLMTGVEGHGPCGSLACCVLCP